MCHFEARKQAVRTKQSARERMSTDRKGPKDLQTPMGSSPEHARQLQTRLTTGPDDLTARSDGGVLAEQFRQRAGAGSAMGGHL